jgi:multidrug efflux pump subunit AcrB
MVDVRLPESASIETTSAATAKVEAWLRQQPEAKIVTAHIGQGSPRFFISYNSELSDPSFAKIIALTPDATACDRLMAHLRVRVAQGLAPEALVRATPFVFDPFVPYPVAFRVTGFELS